MTRIQLLLVSVACLFLQQNLALAQQDYSNQMAEQNYARQIDRYQNFDTMMSWSSDTTWQLKPSDVVDMLDWLSHQVSAQTAEDMIDPKIPKYNRIEHFAGWIKQYPKDCHDTRAAVLMRAADPGTVIFTSNNKCRVESGNWLEPYTGKTVKDAKELQIDHVVPLQHAYYAGAAQWTHNKRCHYANFLDNDFHLLAVSGHENMSKGDKGPEGYLPPNHAFDCAYMTDWMKIKTIWQLKTSQAEIDGLRAQMKAYHCTSDDQTISATELAEQRADAEHFIDRCPQD